MAGEREQGGQFARWHREAEERAARDKAFKALPFSQRWVIKLGEIIPGVSRLARAVGIDTRRP